MHEGHRERLLERAKNSAELQDHELLEAILFRPIPRKNTNEIAHRLLAAFGSLHGVFSAGEGELALVEGVGKQTAQYLRCVAELFRRMSSEEIPKPDAYNFHGFSAFIKSRFEGLNEEVLDLYCLDRADHILHTARFTSHDGSRVGVAMNELGGVLMTHCPYSIVVAHNHPAAPAAPSPADDEFTSQLQLLCSLNNIKLRDHIIAGRNGMFSYFTSGKLEEIESTYDVQNLLTGKGRK